MFSEPITQKTLLQRLKDVDDRRAWDVFFSMYAPVILGFCRAWRCDYEMANEVLQETMVTLISAIPEFDYDPTRGRFRTYLLAVVKNRIREAFRRQQRYQSRHCSVDDQAEDFARIFGADAAQPGQEWDDLWRRNLALQALSAVRERVDETVYRSFVMNVLENRPVKEIADELGLKANQIYQQKDRLKKMLRESYQAVLAEFGD